MDGEGQLTLTGQLGDVMKESAHLAISWLRSNAKKYHLTNSEWWAAGEVAVGQEGPLCHSRVAKGQTTFERPAAPLDPEALAGPVSSAGRPGEVQSRLGENEAVFQTRTHMSVLPINILKASLTQNIHFYLFDFLF